MPEITDDDACDITPPTFLQKVTLFFLMHYLTVSGALLVTVGGSVWFAFHLFYNAITSLFFTIALLIAAFVIFLVVIMLDYFISNINNDTTPVDTRGAPL